MSTEGNKVEPGSNQRPWFVGRKEQLSKFDKVVKSILPINRLDKKKFHNLNLIEYSGIHGIGKTSLIKQEIEKCKLKGIPYVYIDFAKEQGEDKQYYKNPNLYFKEIVKELKKEIPELDTGSLDLANNEYKTQKVLPLNGIDDFTDVIREIKDKPRKNQNVPEWFVKLKNVNQKFLNLIGTQSSLVPKPIVFFFDNIDTLDPGTIKFIQTCVIDPIVNGTKNAAVVISTLQQFILIEHRTKVRSSFNLIPSLNLGEIAEQVELEGGKDLVPYSDMVALITGGHPGANSIAISTLKNLKNDLIDPNINSKEKIVKLIISDFVFDYIQESVFSGQSDIIKSALTGAAMVRQFDSKMLQKVLPVFDPDRFQQRNSDYFNALKIKLIETGLVKWTIEGSGISRDIQYPLQKHLLVTNPKLFNDLNQVAIDIYTDLLKNHISKESAPIFLVELLWHKALKSLVENPNYDPRQRLDDISNTSKILLKDINDYFVHKNVEKIDVKLDMLIKDLIKFSPNSF